MPLITPHFTAACALLSVASNVHGASASSPGVSQSAPKQPNIIFLQVDSMDGRLVDPTSPYSAKVSLPNLRALQQAGTTFARTYTASPQCVPSRTSMITSRFVHEINTWSNCQGIARSTATGLLDSNCVSEWSRAQCEAFAAEQRVNVTFFDSLKSAGYGISIRGRLDMGNGLLDEHPYATGDGFHGGPTLAIQSRAADILLSTDTNPANEIYPNDPTPYAPDINVADEAVAFFQSYKPSNIEPFFLLVGFLDPHPPYSTNSTFLAHVNESAVDVPPVLPLDAMHPYDVYMSVSKNAYHNYTDEQIKSVRRSYWGAVAEADDLVGRVLAAASANGFLNNTIVIFTSDHGEMAMEHRQDLKNAMYEGSTRIPMIVAGYGTAQVIPAGQVVTNYTSNLDIYPTMMDLTGTAQPDGLRGTSLQAFLGGAGPAHPDYIASEYHSNLANTGSFMLRQGDWKFITFGRNFAPFANYSDMLYNVTADPNEMVNLVTQYPSVAASMLATLTTELREDPQSIDARAKANDLALYKTFWQDAYAPAGLYTQFQDTYTGFDASNAAQVEAWCGTTP